MSGRTPVGGADNTPRKDRYDRPPTAAFYLYTGDIRTIKRDIVAAIIYSREGKILQALKANDGHNVWHDCWHIPGGGVEDGETHQQALEREIMEEVGLDISPYPSELVYESTGIGEKTLRDSGERVMVDMHFFTYAIHIDTPAAEIPVDIGGQEFVEYGWTAPANLKKLKLTPPSTDMFTRMGYL